MEGKLTIGKRDVIAFVVEFYDHSGPTRLFINTHTIDYSNLDLKQKHASKNLYMNL